LVRFAPPPPKPEPKSRQGKIRNAKAAAKAARQGRVDEAAAALRTFADAGDAAAAASLAEILAFRGEWEPMVTYAAMLLAQPEAVYAGNVFTDLARLVRRAAVELGDLSIIDEVAAKVPPSHADRRQATLPQQPVPSSADLAGFAVAVADAETGKRFRDRPVERAAHLFSVAVALGIDD
jgi:hypothetical protein